MPTARARELDTCSPIPRFRTSPPIPGCSTWPAASWAIRRFRATLFEKSADSNWLVVWHQDTALPLRGRFEAEGWGPWSTKKGILYCHAPSCALSRVVALRVHLDPSHEQNGPLRIIPASHALGVLTDDEVAAVSRESDHVECLVPPGGVLAMRPLLIHSSPKSASADARTVLHLEYADTLRLGPGIELATA